MLWAFIIVRNPSEQKWCVAAGLRAAEKRPPRSCLQGRMVLGFILPYMLPARPQPFLPMLLIALSNSR